MKVDQLWKVARLCVKSQVRADSLLTGAFNRIADNIGSITVEHGVYTESGHYIGKVI